MHSDTGEHISNEKNELQYVPFSVCNETGKPLELQYGVEQGMFLILALSCRKSFADENL